MATINSIFTTARSGITVAQTAASLVARNLANQQTPGYAREILPIAAALGGLGVSAGASVGMRATLLERALQTATGRTSFHESQVNHLTLAETAVNDLDGVGLGSDIEDFRTAIAALAANPSGTSEREQMLSTGRSLGASFASTRSQLDASASNVRSEAVSVAGQVSDLASQIARIDQRVRSARPGEERNTYVTQRAALVGTLSSLVDVDVRTNDDGTIRVSTAGGRTLVEGGSASRMVVESAGSPTQELTVSFERDGVKLAAMAGSQVGGALGGLIAAHEDTLMPAVQQLDALAFDFVNTFNATHAAGFTATGAPGGAFFATPTSTAGAAASVALASLLKAGDIAGASDPSAGVGDNSNLLILADIAGQGGTLASGTSLPASWRGISTLVSRALVNAQDGAEFEASSRDQLQNLLASETGVSIDEEMFNLTLAQTALEASSKVIAAAQQMTDTVLSLVG